MPESTAHDAALYRIYSLLVAWAARAANGARIARNLAICWLPEHPKTGLDPDICVLLPEPADFDELTSFRVWEAGRTPPPLAIEVVSGSHPYKDYRSVHEGYAAMGVQELLVFDPLLLGPKALGGPVALQLWRRDESGAFERAHFGNQPVYSNVLDAWLLVAGRDLHIADDRGGSRRWPTEAEEARQQAASALADVQRVEAEKDRLEADNRHAQSNIRALKAAAEREQRLRQELEQKVAELEAEKRRK